MLVSALLLVYAFLLSLLLGNALLRLFQRLTQVEVPRPHVSVLVLLGLCFATAVLQVLHLFDGMQGPEHLVMWMVAIAGNAKGGVGDVLQVLKRDTTVSRYTLIVLACLLLAAVINIAGRAGTGDIGDYHLQAIQWDEQYAVVKGLGNLRRQLGNNSNWFLLHAFFGMHFLGLKSAYILNAMLLLVSVWYFTPRPNDRFVWLKGFVLVYLLLMSFRKYVGAVTNDYAITVFTLVLFTEWISNSAQQARERFHLIFMILLLPTFKLSAITTLTVVLVFVAEIWRSKARMLSITFLVVSGVLIYLPWMITNVQLSGYLCYPVDAIDWFDVDWKMRASMLEYERMINIANERAPGVEPDQVMQMPFLTWFIHWLTHLDVFSLLLLLCFKLMLIGFIGAGVVNKAFGKFLRKGIGSTQSLPLLLALAVTLPVWFLNAPATRFVFGYLVFFIALGFQWIMEFKNRQARSLPVLWPALTCLLLFANAGVFMLQGPVRDKVAAGLLTPLPYTNETYNKVNITGGYILQPDSNCQCWDMPLPCTSIRDSTLRWRGETLSEGFTVK